MLRTDRPVFRLRLAILLVVFVTLFSLSFGAAALAAVSTRIYVVMLPNPNVLVQPGEVIEYELAADNVGEADAAAVRVTVSYDPEHLTLVGARFEGDQDWVNDTESDDLTRAQVRVTLRDVGDEEQRSAYLQMQVNPELPEGTVITTFGKFSWSDGSGDRSSKPTNTTPVIVAGTNLSSDLTWMDVTPRAALAEAPRTFYSDRFLPDEKVVFWVVLPDGTVEAVNEESEVDEDGRFDLIYPTDNLPAGVYTMTAYGLNSKLTATAQFEVLTPTNN